MPLIKNQTTATTAAATTTTTTMKINEIDKTATTQSTHKSKQKPNTANNIATTTTTTTATKTNETAKTTISTLTKTANNSNSSSSRQKQKQQKPINDIIITKRKKHYYNNSSSNKHRKHKNTLAKSVPATPVQVNPLTTNHFVPSSPDFYDDDDDDDNDDDVLYMPPYSYPNCSLDILNGDYHFDNEFNYNVTQTPEFKRAKDSVDKEEQHFREAFDHNHAMELQRDIEEDSASMAMITPPPPYDTPYGKQLQQYPYTAAQYYPQQHVAYTAPKAQRSNNTPHTRKYIFNNNREQFNISSSNGNSSSNSIQQQTHSTSLGSTLTNAITPTKLSAAAAAMFAAPQIVQLNRKWSNLHRKRRRRNSSSGDSKELDKLVLQSVDWDENDIY